MMRRDHLKLALSILAALALGAGVYDVAWARNGGPTIVKTISDAPERKTKAAPNGQVAKHPMKPRSPDHPDPEIRRQDRSDSPPTDDIRRREREREKRTIDPRRSTRLHKHW